jgi:hypothetical protein
VLLAEERRNVPVQRHHLLATPAAPMHRHFPFSFSTAVVILAVGGCGQAREGRGDDTSAAGAPGEPREARVTWDKHGVIDRRWGIEGSWHSYSDCASGGVALGFPCTRLDPQLLGPDGREGWATSASQVCMKGTVPKVELTTDRTLAYDYQWGAGWGFTLGVGMPYDATAHNIIGFMFDVTHGSADAPAPATLRIRLTMPTTAEDHHFITIALPSLDRRVMFDEVEQGEWVMVPREFRPEAIDGVGFEVYSNNQAPKDFDFCVSNFRVVCAGECIP